MLAHVLNAHGWAFRHIVKRGLDFSMDLTVLVKRGLVKRGLVKRGHNS